MQTHSEEDYLKAIYQLHKQGHTKVSLTALASQLGNKPASVIDMIKKMTEKKLVEYDKISGAKLSDSGKKAALLVIRKHRLWEFFLQDKLGYTWDEVHQIAEQLEHVHDDELADRLDEFLNFPRFDPHGDPIPDRNGKFPEIKSVRLTEAKHKESGFVVGLADMSPVFLQYLDKVGIHIGTEIAIIESNVFDDSLDIKINGKSKIHLSQQAAKNILISRTL
ncbi:MAG TPA: metal-dependent transcriptional regulator [Bacteroidales bacterium]|nr:metal-dependent transcriptional regulator [Bacteroidales bacterium]